MDPAIQRVLESIKKQAGTKGQSDLIWVLTKVRLGELPRIAVKQGELPDTAWIELQKILEILDGDRSGAV